MRHYRWKCKRDSGVGIRLFQLIIVPRRLIFCLPGFVFSSPLLLPIRHTVSETADCTITLRIVYIFYFFHNLYTDSLRKIRSAQPESAPAARHILSDTDYLRKERNYYDPNFPSLCAIHKRRSLFDTRLLDDDKPLLLQVIRSIRHFSGGYMAACCFPQP